MKKQLCLIGISLTFGIATSFLAPDYFEWSKEKKLSFADFKGTAPKKAGKDAVNLALLTNYKISQVKNKVPEITVYNYVDREQSWIKVKKQEILEIQQIKFDYAELQIRKIRKVLKEMNQKGIKDKNAYVDKLTQMANQAKKKSYSNFVLMEDQPHFIAMMKKEVSDSLKMYEAYAK